MLHTMMVRGITAHLRYIAGVLVGIVRGGSYGGNGVRGKDNQLRERPPSRLSAESCQEGGEWGGGGEWREGGRGGGGSRGGSGGVPR